MEHFSKVANATKASSRCPLKFVPAADELHSDGLCRNPCCSNQLLHQLLVSDGLTGEDAGCVSSICVTVIRLHILL